MCSLGAAAVLSFVGCGDDSEGTPDEGSDTWDGGTEAEEDVPADEAIQDRTPPDEPIGPDDYPPGPYGVVPGTRIDNLQFVDLEGNVLRLSDIYADRSVKLLWIYATAGWCSACGAESSALDDVWDAYNPDGLQILGAIFEDGSGNPATVRYANSYEGRYDWPFPAVADQEFALGRYFDKLATPMNMLIDLTDMEILRIEVGWDQGAMENYVELYLSEIADRS
jgi:hypothetical protein